MDYSHCLEIWHSLFLLLLIIKYNWCLLQKQSNAEMYKTSNSPEVSSKSRQTQLLPGFPCSSSGKECVCNAGDLGLIPGLGKSPGEGNGSPLQCSGLENFMDCITHRVAKSRTSLETSTHACFQIFIPCTVTYTCIFQHHILHVPLKTIKYQQLNTFRMY